MKNLSNEKRFFITWSLIFFSQSIIANKNTLSAFFLQNSAERNLITSLLFIITAIILYLNYPVFLRHIKEDYRLNPAPEKQQKTHSQKYLSFYIFAIAFLMVFSSINFYSDIAKTDSFPKILATFYFFVFVFIVISYRIIFKKEESH